MNLLHVASFNHVPGENEEAKKLLRKVAAFINQKSPGANVQILHNVDGLFHRMHLVSTYESVSAWKAAHDARQTDSGWQDLLAQGREVLDFSSIENHLFEVIE